jgi:hypothetical protein
MILARLIGWCLIAVAFIAASAEAVLALGPEPRPSLATGEVWTLISGVPASSMGAPDHWGELLAAAILILPAWVVMAALGLSLVLVGRMGRRRPRARVFG